MSETERIQKIVQYIHQTNFPNRPAYCLLTGELQAIRNKIMDDPYHSILLLFEYGRAKGYQAAMEDSDE